jgi:hypothetical protein
MIRRLCIQSFPFSKIGCSSIAIANCVGTRRRVQGMVQKRRDRNLRLSEFGISDVLLPQDLLGGQLTQSTAEFDSFTSPAALVGESGSAD